jgi:hypothetical protein
MPGIFMPSVGLKKRGAGIAFDLFRYRKVARNVFSAL